MPGKKEKKRSAKKGSSSSEDGAQGAQGAQGGPEGTVSVSPAAEAAAGLDPAALAKIKEAMRMLQLREMSESATAPKSAEDALKKNYQFWDTQPVPKLNEEIATNECIAESVSTDRIKQEPFSLPANFEWDTLNIDDPLVLKELYVLLNENYVEDDDNMFRFDYSPEFLRWALLPPGHKRVWHAGVRIEKNKKLVAFISAIPANIRVYEKKIDMVEINFLCVHKKLRSKRLAPVLIKEITRRVNVEGLFQAVYTAGVVLPKPVGTCRYWHRSLNPKKLIEVKFSHLSRNMTMQRHLKLFRLPEETKTPGLRKMKREDVPKACKLLNEYLNKFDLCPSYSEKDFSHWFLPRENIVECYVVENPVSKELTDMISFYSLPSTVMNHPQHNLLRAAYSFYNVANTVNWGELMGDALVLAKKADFDVFNALDLMNNQEFLEKLKFGVGDGNLQYYLYNWRCPGMEPKKIGLVLQ